jgi:hypothetical protein
MLRLSMIFFVCVAGVIKTTGRKLDRESQAEHILEVSKAKNYFNVGYLLLSGAFLTCT